MPYLCGTVFVYHIWAHSTDSVYWTCKPYERRKPTHRPPKRFNTKTEQHIDGTTVQPVRPAQQQRHTKKGNGQQQQQKKEEKEWNRWKENIQFLCTFSRRYLKVILLCESQVLLYNIIYIYIQYCSVCNIYYPSTRNNLCYTISIYEGVYIIYECCASEHRICECEYLWCLNGLKGK